jgi:hypothetical protein
MALLDTIKDGLTKVIPQKKPTSLPTHSMGLTGGIGNGHGMIEDDVSLSLFASFSPLFRTLYSCTTAHVASFALL